MITNKFLIWLNIILFLFILVLFFESRREEINIYKDPTLQYFGMNEAEIIDRYGEPDFEGGIGGPGGKVLFYEELKTSFIFAGNKGVVNNLELFPSKEFLKVKVGMSFDEIEEIMGSPRNRAYDHYENDYVMTYYLGKEKEGMGEVEVWFSADEDDAATKKAQIFWKKYWR